MNKRLLKWVVFFHKEVTMVKFVKKRDGSIVPFEKQKIINAIGKAGFVKEGIKEKIADEILHQKQEELSVEAIQDLVENKLMASSCKETAKEYIRYRYKRKLIRETKDSLSEVLDIVNLSNQEVNEENSNKNPTSYSDLKVISPTLIKIDNKKVTSYIEGEDAIKDVLKN